MSTEVDAYVDGFLATCRKDGLSVKAAASALWRNVMQSTPDFIAGVVKGACENAHLLNEFPLPPPSIPVNRDGIKQARATLSLLDEHIAKAASDGNRPLRTALIRRRDEIQRALNDYISEC